MRRTLLCMGSALLALASAGLSASDCCEGYNIFALLGLVPGRACIGLSAYRPYFITLTIIFSASAFLAAYLKRSGKIVKTVPWVSAVVAFCLMLLPYYGARVNSSAAVAVQSTASLPTATAHIAKVVLQVEGEGEMKGMACIGCQRNLQNTLLEVKGVKSADVSLKTQQAIVEYEVSQTRPEDLVKAAGEAGFVAKVVKE